MRSPSTVVILAGGMASFKGLSLAPVPKCFLPIANHPLYHYLAMVLGATGVKLLIFCVPVGLQTEVDKLLSLSPPPIDYLIKETGNGSGGSLLEVADCIQDESFWVANGDLLVDTDLTPMLAYHQERCAKVTAAGIQVQEVPWWMERIETDTEQGIKAIHRIHPFQCKRSKLRPVGLYLFEKAVLDLIPQSCYFDLKEQLFPPLYEIKAVTGVWEVQGYCHTITSLEDYFFANQDVLRGVIKVSKMSSPTCNTSNPVPPQISSSAKLYEPLAIGAGTRIGEEAMVLGPTVIGPNCEISPGTIVNRCVILRNAKIGPGTYLDGCIIPEGTIVEGGEILREVVFLKGPYGEKERVVLSLRSQGVPHYGEVQWQTPSRPFYLKVKRLLDIVASVILLVVCSPIVLLIVLAIKQDSPGKVIWPQERCGKNGRKFIMYKFRSMTANAADLKRQLLCVNEVDGPMFKIINDPRVTRVGKVLRNINLDELPQLWNVLKGDMSLVGPRPLSMEEMLCNPRWRDARLSVLPGLTGFWQVTKHTGLSFRDWIRYDIEYVQQCSLWLDLKILFWTIYKMVLDCWYEIWGKLL